jgi:long-chain fatty acid transport protein
MQSVENPSGMLWGRMKKIRHLGGQVEMYSLRNVKVRICAVLSIFATGGAGAALGAGFYIQEQNAAGVGRAQAGNGAVADDASTVYYNPAGLTELDGMQVTGGIDVVVPDATMVNSGSTNRSLGTRQAAVPASGGPSGNPGSASVIPDFYTSVPLTQDLTFGFGVTAPFGFASKYPSDWFGRYDSIDSFVETFDFQPTLAWKVNEHVSIGAGLDEQYAYVKLRNALPNAFAAGGPSPATDGRLTLTGHNWATGFTVGILLKPTAETRFGLTYRYGIKHDIPGAVTFSGLAGSLALLNGQLPGSAALDLPDVMTASVLHKLTAELTLLGDFDYYTWSNFKEIRINLTTSNPLVTNPLLTTENYRDTFSVALGAEYQLTEPLKLRAGVKFDQTPTVDLYRDTRVPDGDRYWLSFGVNYKLSEAVALDASYAHIFVDNAPINVTRAFYQIPGFSNGLAASTITGHTEVGLDILTAGFTYRF